MKWLIVIAAVLGMGAGPGTRPASQPAFILVLPEEQQYREAAEAQRTAEAKCLETFRSSASYVPLKSARDHAEKKLEDARRAGSPEDRLKASHDFVVADQALKSAERKAVVDDAGVKTATENAAQLKAAWDRKVREVDAAEKAAAAAEQARIANDPNNVAIREGKIILGMSEKDARSAFENRKRRNLEEGRTRGGTVSMSGDRAAGLLNVRPRELVRQTQDEIEGGVKRITFTRYLRYMNGSEYDTDEVSVVFQDGKVFSIHGQ